MITQSSVILNCSSGMGLKLLMSTDRNLNVSSQCGGTSLWIRSGRTESSATAEQVSTIHETTSVSLRTFSRKVEEQWELLPIRHLGSLSPQFIKERVDHRLDGAQPNLWCIFQKLGDEIDRFGRCAWPEHLSLPINIETSGRPIENIGP